MRPLFALALCGCFLSACFGEDAQLRARAFELVERAHNVSAPNHASPIANETVLTFRALSPDGMMRDGSYSRVFAGSSGTREEFAFPDFHLVKINLSDRVAFIGTSRVLPAEIREMLRLLPIQLWHLDAEDVVREIKPTKHNGVDAHCIEFDTTRGAESFANEMCFDAQTGAEIYDRSGNTELENSEFFDFAGAKLPGHIAQYRRGALVLDIHLTRRIVTEALSPDMFTPPPSADIGMRCKTFRRAFGLSMPQPPGTGGAITNVVVHALIGGDGTVREAAIEDSDRPDLNQEALQIARGWTFTPAMCNGKPNTQQANLVVRFQGR